MKVWTICVAILLVLPGLASAGLIVNGGFETGDFTGWTVSGQTDHMGVSGSYAYSGAYGAYFGQVGGLGFISQTIATVAGAWYDANFWLDSPGGTPNEFQFLWDGGTILDLVNASSFGWTEYTYHLQATSPSTVVTFGFRQDPSYWGFDDADVNAAGAVPEPASFALIGLGLTGLALLGRKWRTS